jgi:hypothetical protein
MGDSRFGSVWYHGEHVRVLVCFCVCGTFGVDYLLSVSLVKSQIQQAAWSMLRIRL